jgi:hypothetical protein
MAGRGRPKKVENLFKGSNVQFEKGHKSKGILDDYAVRKNIAAKEGTVEKVPVNDSDIANKQYVDSQISGENHWDAGGTVGNETLYPHIITSKVGIGTTSPNYKLDIGGVPLSGSLSEEEYGLGIKGTGTNGDTHLTMDSEASRWAQINLMDDGTVKWRIRKDNNNEFDLYSDTLGSSVIHAKENGNVGIGTTSPNTDLHIDSTGTGNEDLFALENDYGGNDLGPAMKFIRSGSVLSRIRGIEEGSWDGGLAFEVVDTAGSSIGRDGATTEAMRIDYSGKVGIGTTSPSYGKLEIEPSSLGDNSLLSFTVKNGVNNPRAFISHVTATDNQYLEFDSSYSSGSGFADWIFSNGNVGIGTTAPGAKLDVNSDKIIIENSKTPTSRS